MNNILELKTGSELSQSQNVPDNKLCTTLAEIDQQLQLLQANKDKWVQTGIEERIKILDKIRRDMKPVSPDWVRLSMAAKGIVPNTFPEQEEKIFLGSIFGLITVLRKSMSDIKRYGRPHIPGPVEVLPNGQVCAKVFPQKKADTMMFPGVSAEVLMQPGVAISEMVQSQAKMYTNQHYPGAVSLVLGAGNVSCLPITDIMYRLFVADRVVVLKLNPVNDYLGPLIEKGFRALINPGFLRIVYGGAAEGNYLCNHALVDEIHLTGSDKTFETIIFGPGTGGSERKAQKKPLITKPVTGELGNITPVIIVPGPWSAEDIGKQAQKITIWLAFNAGCNCLTPRVLIQDKNWAQRELMIKAIGGVMAHMDTRKAYYPGAIERHAAFVAAHPNACQFGDSSNGHLPWTIIPDIDPKNTQDICFNTEAFCSLFAETALEADDIPGFIDRAVDFVNGTLWGTLTASIIVHPQSLLDPKIAASVERALLNLHYGTVCVNEWGATGYASNTTPGADIPAAIFTISNPVSVL